MIGYGEVGRILTADMQARGIHDLIVWDRLFASVESVPSRAAAVTPHLHAATGAAEALRERTHVISAVTASESLAVAREIASLIEPDTIVFDLNSVSPRTKRAAAAVIDAAGGRYVEAAVMSPIGPKRIESPMLIGGPHAAAFLTDAHAMGFRGVRVCDGIVGRASAAKMCRSVMIKGIESLLVESLLTARRYRVEDIVLESLHDLFPHEDWERLAAYMVSRSLQHGGRRAEEMREAAGAVAEAGLAPWMSEACVRRQQWAAAHATAGGRAALVQILDTLLAAIPDVGVENA